MDKKKIIFSAIAGAVIILSVSACALIESEHVAGGHKLYASYCASCHGAKGRGDGYNSANLDPLPRDLSDRKEVYMAKLTNEEIFKFTSLGGKALKKSSRMPPYGGTLSEKEMWEIVAYIRTLHSYKNETIDFESGFDTKRPKTAFKKIGSDKFQKIKKREKSWGKKLYKSQGCSACHKIGDKGGVAGPELTHIGARLNGAWMYRFLRSPQSVINHTSMPNYKLDEKRALRLTYYLLSLK